MILYNRCKESADFSAVSAAIEGADLAVCL